jgi:hypothetical protein
MSIAPLAPPTLAEDPPESTRVRHQARDAATLMVFSAAMSAGGALFLLFLAVLARQA